MGKKGLHCSHAVPKPIAKERHETLVSLPALYRIARLLRGADLSRGPLELQNEACGFWKR